MIRLHRKSAALGLLTVLVGLVFSEPPAFPAPAVSPLVEIEENVYTFEPANNGAGPLWCSGSTCLVRAGDGLFASGLETLKELKPLNNCRWVLFKREPEGWRLQQADTNGRTREPCPLAGFPDGRLFLSANPTTTATNVYAGPAKPEILQFSAAAPRNPPEKILPVWDGAPAFSEHSYRSFSADGPRGELILFQNIGYTHAEWAFRDAAGKWSSRGKLAWPNGTNYPKPEPVRVCYPDVALKNRAVHFCGVSDIIEPYPEWRAFKKNLTGLDWDYDFRRLFYTWTADITTGRFKEWIEIASRDKTCGWVSPGDLWVGPDGAAHIVWTERAIDERLRARFFPEARQSHSLNYAVMREGTMALKKTLLLAEEGRPGLIASAPRFHITPEDRLFLICYVQGTDSAGKRVSENRLMELGADGSLLSQVKIGFATPFVSYFTTTPRAGSPPSPVLELLGHRNDMPGTLSYARVRLR